MRRRSLAAIACAALLALLDLSGCAHGKHANEFAPEPPRLPPEPPSADSVTVGLWHFDERSGPRVQDAGPFRMTGVAGPAFRWGAPAVLALVQSLSLALLVGH